ncbi:MAG: efflux RND transporter periplasmic adaptor subunit [Gemmatimonadaceae bacterium]
MNQTDPKRERQDLSPPVHQHGWDVKSGRRWPIIGIAVVLVVVVILVLRRGRDGSAVGDIAGGEPRASVDPRETIDSVVTLDSTAMRLAEIQVGLVARAGAGALIANGTITYDANHASVVAPRAEGRVSELRVDLGQSVRAGSVLAMIDSREVAQTRADVERARAGVEVTQNSFEREKRLYEQRISSQKEMLEAQGAYKTALAEYNGAVAQLGGLGAGPGEAGVYGLASSIGGIVVERNAMPGQVVGPSTNLFTVADLRRVWITVDVYESDLARVRQGAKAIVTPRAFADEVFHGWVTYAGGVVDTTSRTLKVRVEVDNAARRLRPGMFAQVRIESPHAVGAGSAVAVIPQLAVQDLNGKTIVFVPTVPAGRFVARQVVVGSSAGSGLVAITAGLRVGDMIVTKGAFQLKAQLTKGSFGDEK